MSAQANHHQLRSPAVQRGQEARAQLRFQPLSPGVGRIPGMYMQPTIAIGDVHAAFPGNEIVSSAAQQLTVLLRDPVSGWRREMIFDARELIGQAWGARVGDADPDRPGEEIVYIYEGVTDHSFGTLFSEIGGLWMPELIYEGEVGMDSVIGEVNPAHPGAEVVVVTEMGPTYELLRPSQPAGQWPKNTLWNVFDDAAWAVEIADVDPATPGYEIVYGTRYNNRIALSRRDGSGGHELEVLFAGIATNHPWNMWDIAVGQVLPETAALEILGVDQTGSVYLVRSEAGGWQGEVVWQDPAPLFAVVTGDFNPLLPGDEILVAGGSGAITLLERTGPEPLPGDMNCDGVFNGGDIDPFFLALGDPAAYTTQFPNCNILLGDMNGDGAVNGGDIDPFFACLGGGACP